MRILKFKSQLMVAFFAAVNHLNWPLRKQNFTLMGSKGHCSWFVIGGFQSILCVSRFVACGCNNYDWRQQKTQLWRRLLNLRVCMFVKSTVMNKLDLYINNMVQRPAVNNRPKCKDLGVSYGQWSFIRIKQTTGYFFKTRSWWHVYFWMRIY